MTAYVLLMSFKLVFIIFLEKSLFVVIFSYGIRLVTLLGFGSATLFDSKNCSDRPPNSFISFRYRHYNNTSSNLCLHKKIYDHLLQVKKAEDWECLSNRSIGLIKDALSKSFRDMAQNVGSPLEAGGPVLSWDTDILMKVVISQ